MAKIGIVPGQDFDIGKLDPAVAQALAGVPKAAHRKDHGRVSRGTRPATLTAGSFTTKTGIYGTDYLQRALITAIGLGANRPQDAVYPTSEADADGKPYNGAKQVRDALRQGPDAAGRWLLVADHVRCAITSSSPTRSTATR